MKKVISIVLFAFIAGSASAQLNFFIGQFDDYTCGISTDANNIYTTKTVVIQDTVGFQLVAMNQHHIGGTYSGVLCVNDTGGFVRIAPAAFVNPVAVMYKYAGASPPNGYLACDGAAVSRTTYATLFAVIGTTYGPGDGTTTFNLPNDSGFIIKF